MYFLTLLYSLKTVFRLSHILSMLAFNSFEFYVILVDIGLLIILPFQVLLTELAYTWPARTKWMVDQLSLNYGDVAFRISQRSSKKITMKFRDYISYMEVQHDEDPLYIFDEKVAPYFSVL